MNCRGKSELIARYIDGDITSLEVSHLQEHLTSCARCRRDLQAQQRLLGILETEVPDRFETDLDTSFLYRPGQINPRTERGLFRNIAAVVVAAVAIFTLWHFLASPTGHAPSRTATGTETPTHAPLRNVPFMVRKPAGGKIDIPNSFTSPRQRVTESSRLALTTNTSEKGRSTDQTPVTVIRSKEVLVAVISAQAPVIDGIGEPVKVGTRLPAGAVVKTGRGGRVTLVTRKGALINLNSGSELALLDKGTAELRKGRLYCSNRAKEISEIDTPAGRIKLLGTVLDAAVVNPNKVAVTVVEGKVRLTNSIGHSLVDAGTKSVMETSRAPQSGMPVDTAVETAWYRGRGSIESDSGEIAYTVTRDMGLTAEIWAMKPDGSGRHRLKTYLGRVFEPGPWYPGDQLLQVKVFPILWNTPRAKERSAHIAGGGGSSIAGAGTFLLDTLTGQDMPLTLPAGCDPYLTSLSPDSKKLAFSGVYRSSESGDTECGVWVCDVSNGKMSERLGEKSMTPIAWSPDSRWLTFSTGKDYSDTQCPLVTADALTGTVSQINAQGADACYSPDGRKLAFCGGFMSKGPATYFRGVPDNGSVWVMDLLDPSALIRLSPNGEGALEPSWSPDGTRILYYALHNTHGTPDSAWYSLNITNADGSGTREIFRGKGSLEAASWARSGDAVYASTQGNIMLIAADGSKVEATFSSHPEDCHLTPEAEAQTSAALSDIREAVYQYALGSIHVLEGRPLRSRTCFRRTSDLLSGLMWRYPLADISPSSALPYAEKADEMAAKTDQAVLSASCKERLVYLERIIISFAYRNKRLPHDLSELEDWTINSNWGDDAWLFGVEDKEHIRMLFRCPAALCKGLPDAYVYLPNGDNAFQIGEVFAACRHCRENSLRWDKELQECWDWLKRIQQKKK